MKRLLPYITLLFSIISIALSGYLFFNSLITPLTPTKIACDKTDLLYLKIGFSNLAFGTGLEDNFRGVLSHPCFPKELKEATVEANEEFIKTERFKTKWYKEHPDNARMDDWTLKSQFPEINFVFKEGDLIPESALIYSDLRSEFLESQLYVF